MGNGKTVFQQKNYGSKDAQNEIDRLLQRVLKPVNLMMQFVYLAIPTACTSDRSEQISS